MMPSIQLPWSDHKNLSPGHLCQVQDFFIDFVGSISRLHWWKGNLRDVYFEKWTQFPFPCIFSLFFSFFFNCGWWIGPSKLCLVYCMTPCRRCFPESLGWLEVWSWALTWLSGQSFLLVAYVQSVHIRVLISWPHRCSAAGCDAAVVQSINIWPTALTEHHARKNSQHRNYLHILTYTY